MKKLGVSLLTIGGVALAACGGSTNKYVITSQLADDSMNGETVYMTNLLGDKLDSTIVSDNQLRFERELINPDMVVVTLNQAKGETVLFPLESGETTIDFENNKVTGGVLTQKYEGLISELRAFQDQVDGEYRAMAKEMQNEELDSAAKEELQRAFEARYMEELMPQIKNKLTGFLVENKDNVLSVMAFANAQGMLSEGEQIELAEQLSPAMAKNPFIEKFTEGIEAFKATSEGKMFTDFTVTQEDGTEVSLSDYVGKGKYVLVDFWASWCGPCRREMPNLKEVYEKYTGDKFEILGVTVWDKLADSKKAIEEDQLPWSQILDAQAIPTTLYGIKGIPHIILFGPDGTIVKRGLRGEAIAETLEELLN